MRRASGKTAGMIAICLSAAALQAMQADPTTAPADENAPLQIIISASSGIVQVRQTGGDAWQPVQIGQEFAEGVEFRTGVRSAVKFRIPPDSDITLDRLGVVKVLRASIENGTIKTDVGMKYGRARYDIEAAGRTHDAKIRSASSVLAIRGTDVILEDSPGFAPKAVSITGRAQFRDSQGNTSSFGAKNADRPTRIDSAAGSAAETGLQQSISVSPLNAGRTANENRLVTNIPQAGGVPPPPMASAAAQPQSLLLSAVETLPDTITMPPAVPPISLIPGRLEFVLDWTGQADLQIGVLSPAGEPITTNPAAVLSPPNGATGPIATTSATGGAASADNRGAGGSGKETVVWPNGYPAGVYDYGVKYNTGSASASYNLDVIVNGVTLEPRTNGNLQGPTADEFEGNRIEIRPQSAVGAQAAAPVPQSVNRHRRKK